MLTFSQLSFNFLLKPIGYHNCDSTTTRLRRKIDMYRSRIVISITSVVVECIVVSSCTTYRRLVVVESQL